MMAAEDARARLRDLCRRLLRACGGALSVGRLCAALLAPWPPLAACPLPARVPPTHPARPARRALPSPSPGRGCGVAPCSAALAAAGLVHRAPHAWSAMPPKVCAHVV